MPFSFQRPKITIESVAFKGMSKLKEADLLATIDTDHGRINAPGGIVDQTKLDDAITKIADAYNNAVVQNAYEDNPYLPNFGRVVSHTQGMGPDLTDPLIL